MKVFLVFIIINFIDLTRTQEKWSYNSQTKWPGICATGKQQSPINILTNDAVVDKNHIRGPLRFQGYHKVKVVGENNGHTLKWTVVADEDTKPFVSGGPLRGTYTFLQFHLHWLAEHSIDAVRCPFEIHMVHVKTELTVEEAVERPDGLAVLGFLGVVSSSNGAGNALNGIMPHVPYLLDEGKNTTPYYLDLTKMFSPDLQSYYTYQGSLTTPKCQEVVTWIVMSKPIHLSVKQYKALGITNVETSYNSRNIQATNKRVVYRSTASCSSVFVPSVEGVITNFVRCVSDTVNKALNIVSG